MDRKMTMPLPLPPGPEGLAVDLECPQCEYNWRGLTTPRCPECGFHFEWHDVPRLLHGARSRPTRRERMIRGVIWAGVAVVLLPFAVPLSMVGTVLFTSVALAGLVAGFELLLTRLFTDEVGVEHFRRWWEGALISYGLAALTCLFLGFDVLAALRGGWTHLTAGMWLFIVLLVIELTVLQYAVIAMREKHWGYPIEPVRVLAAVVFSKVSVVIAAGMVLQVA